MNQDFSNIELNDNVNSLNENRNNHNEININKSNELFYNKIQE